MKRQAIDSECGEGMVERRNRTRVDGDAVS